MTNPFEPPSSDAPTPGPSTPPPYGQNPYGQPMPPPAYGQPMPPPYGQVPYGAPYGAPPGTYPGQMRNGLGTAALVLGIIGAVAGAVMVLFWAAFVLGVLAVVFGLIGRGRAKRGEASNKGASTWGFALGVVSLVLSVVGLIVVVTVFRDTVNCIDRAQTQEQLQACNQH
ncbi:MAG: hypothetical protein QOG34_2265 [Frankiaceae bacterium]|jgi:hypothetical protein|nr:hypothetical protein [Frankiaceae bacterium]